MTPTELELIAGRDAEAMARFYDRHVAEVRRFCAAICPPDRVEETVDATWVSFLGRATERPDATPEDLLRKAAREVAATRMELEPAAGGEQSDATCRAMPELLAARANGELAGPEEPVIEHLRACPVCQETAARLEHAEVAFPPPELSARERRAETERRAVRVRARRGGLVGTVRRLANQQREGGARAGDRERSES